MRISRRERYPEDYEDDTIIEDPLHLMTNAIKVHTRGSILNEDATLSNLSENLPNMSKFVMETIQMIVILRSFMKVQTDYINYCNIYSEDKWMKEIKTENPNDSNYSEAKRILQNRVHSVLVLSRSVKGSPLKAFLTYGRDVSNKDLGTQDKIGMIDKLLGKKPDEGEII